MDRIAFILTVGTVDNRCWAYVAGTNIIVIAGRVVTKADDSLKQHLKDVISAVKWPFDGLSKDYPDFLNSH